MRLDVRREGELRFVTSVSAMASAAGEVSGKPIGVISCLVAPTGETLTDEMERLCGQHGCNTGGAVCIAHTPTGCVGLNDSCRCRRRTREVVGNGASRSGRGASVSSTAATPRSRWRVVTSTPRRYPQCTLKLSFLHWNLNTVGISVVPGKSR